MRTQRRWVVLLAFGLLLVLTTSADAYVIWAQAGDVRSVQHDPPDLEAMVRGKPWPGRSYPRAPRARLRPSHPALAAAGNGPPPGIDLDVVTISRAPLYRAYCVQYDDGKPSLCPGTETEQRWPSPGEVVTFTAKVVNQGTVASPAFDYAWAIDGATVMTGTLPGLDAGATVTATLPWAWDHTMFAERLLGEHTVAFTADPPYAVHPEGAIAETYESNNTRADRTDALSLHIAITPEMVAAYDIPWHPDAPYSAEDWLQHQVTAMNWALAQSIYPLTPSGATERVRIDRITVTPTSPVNTGDHDGGWFVTADYRAASGGYDPATDIDWNLVHELSHQIGLIDLYNLDTAATSVEVLDREGMPVNFGFRWPNGGLMGGGDISPHTDPHLYSSHSAAAVTVNKGYRRGYYGEYQYDIPAETAIRVLDNAGAPAAGVAVALYQRNGAANWIGELTLDNTPEITGVTGLDGRFVLTNRSVGPGASTRTDHLLQDNPFGVVDVVGRENRFLVKLGRDDHEEFHWLDITALNLAYWAGDTLSHTLTIDAHVPPGGAPDPPTIVSRQIEGDRASFCWAPADPAVVAGYNVYRAAHPTYAYASLGSPVSGTCFTQTIGTAHRIYAVTTVDLGGTESGFSSTVWAPRLVHPHAVGILGDGTRVVLDPQNGYALLTIRADGRYIRQIGSPHYHLEYSRFLTVDPLDRLIISHPGDYYTDRHSVRVADADGQPILEFGERGSGDGEFQDPAGVAVWGEPCTYGGPYESDPATLLLLHFDGSVDGVDGETGSATGIEFAEGRYGLGVAIEVTDTLTYTTAGNLTRTQGAVEFWLQPGWDGDDDVSHTFFEVGDGWYNRMRVMKDGANNLRFITWNSVREAGVATHVGDWVAGEWHHIAATWEGSEIALYVDGQQRESRPDGAVPDTLADEIVVGASWDGLQQAEAVLDELRISDLARLGNGDSCTYRILVADSGNDRVQVFDGVGTFISTFGSAGTGPGQFDNPQGLAVDGLGRVIVADSDNDRLQVLAFDGTTLSATGVITAGLASPTGVATDGMSRILVADKGHDRILVLDAAGTVLATHTAPNDGHVGPLNAPHGVVSDGAGALVVADTGNRRVVTVRGALFDEHIYLPLISRQ